MIDDDDDEWWAMFDEWWLAIMNMTMVMAADDHAWLSDDKTDIYETCFRPPLFSCFYSNGF